MSMKIQYLAGLLLTGHRTKRSGPPLRVEEKAEGRQPATWSAGKVNDKDFQGEHLRGKTEKKVRTKSIFLEGPLW